MKKLKIWLRQVNYGQLLLEIFSVVFAVLLALFLNSWRDKSEKRAQFKKVKSKIAQEIQSNTLEIENKQKMHRLQLKYLEQIKDSLAIQEKSPYEYDSIGIAIINLKSASWESAKMTQIVNEFDFDKLSEVSEIYKSFETINKLQDNLIANVYSLDFNNPEKRYDAYHAMRSYLIQVQLWEEEILEGIKTTSME